MELVFGSAITRWMGRAARAATGIIQVRTVVLLAMLAVLRKLRIIDFGAAGAQTIFALSAAILSLGGVYWLVRDQDRLLGKPNGGQCDGQAQRQRADDAAVLISRP